MNLGKRLKEERERQGLGQSALCAKIDNQALSQQAISVLERRDSKTSEFAIQIADALGVSVRWLLDGTGDRYASDWPFNRVSRHRWEQCDAEDRGYIQAAINKALEECELNRPSKQRASA